MLSKENQSNMRKVLLTKARLLKLGCPTHTKSIQHI